MLIKERISRSPALVFDPHDWYAETFLAPGEVKRPGGLVRVLLTPETPINWLFRGEAELVTVSSPAGFVAFFDLARALLPPTGEDTEQVPQAIDPPRRVELAAGKYQVRVLCPGYQEAVMALTRPGDQSIRVVLLPGPTYPFPTGRRPNSLLGPTLIRGTVVDTAGRALPNVSVEAPALLRQSLTDAAGQWVLVLDPDNDLTLKPTTPVKLIFGGGAGLTIPAFDFVVGQETSFPLTSLRGEVRGRDGSPLGAAVVSVDGFAPTSRSRSDGAWAYFFPLDSPRLPPRTGEPVVTVKVVATDGRTGTTRVELNTGSMKRVEPIIL